MSVQVIPNMTYEVFERILRLIPGQLVYARIGIANFDNSGLAEQLEGLIGSEGLGKAVAPNLFLRAPSVDAVLAIYRRQVDDYLHTHDAAAAGEVILSTQKRLSLDEVVLKTPGEEVSLTPHSVTVTHSTLTLVIPEYVRELRDMVKKNGQSFGLKYRQPLDLRYVLLDPGSRPMPS